MRFPTLALVLLITGCRSSKTPSNSGAPSSAHNTYPALSGLRFTGRRPDGCEIALSNRTKWAIQPAGASATLRWQPGEPLQLGLSGEPLWPSSITNLATGAIAYARPVGSF